jgi:hypothetical protein
MSAAQKTAILAQVGHFYFGAVGQSYVGANTDAHHGTQSIEGDVLVEVCINPALQAHDPLKTGFARALHPSGFEDQFGHPAGDRPFEILQIAVRPPRAPALRGGMQLCLERQQFRTSRGRHRYGRGRADRTYKRP